MESTKEFLLAGAVAVQAQGLIMLSEAVKAGTSVWTAIAVILIGVGIFVGRGLYKKYLAAKR